MGFPFSSAVGENPVFTVCYLTRKHIIKYYIVCSRTFNWEDISPNKRNNLINVLNVLPCVSSSFLKLIIIIERYYCFRLILAPTLAIFREHFDSSANLLEMYKSCFLLSPAFVSEDHV